MSKRTMFDQWREFKKAYPNSVILFRVGSFYEALELDAYVLRKTIGFKMSARQQGKGYIPMVGFPPTALHTHTMKLLELCINYVVVEQHDEVEEESGIRVRKVDKVVSSGEIQKLSRFKKGYESYLVQDFPLVVETFELNRNRRRKATQGEELIRVLRDLDLESMGGFDALKFLFEWQKRIDRAEVGE